MLLTRLPVPPVCVPAEVVEGCRSLRWAPCIGVLVAIVAGVVMAGATALGLPATITALLVLGMQILTTGGLHEDGLADVTDGFGGGSSPERKLAIMRDSRIGTFGALALGLGLTLRAAALSALLQRHGSLAATGSLVATAALARAGMLLPLWLLPYARHDGLARAVGRIEARTVATAACLAGGIALLAGAATGLDPLRIVAAGLACGLAGWGMTRLAARQIGGVTGDVIGATEQVGEMVVLIVLCAGAATR